MTQPRYAYGSRPYILEYLESTLLSILTPSLPENDTLGHLKWLELKLIQVFAKFHHVDFVEISRKAK